MSKISYGLNIKQKPSLSQRPAPAKRKTIFDDDDEGDAGQGDKLESVSTFNHGGLQKQSLGRPSDKSNISSKKNVSTFIPTKATTNLSAKHTAALHTQTAQDLDPSIYDYDGVYDSLHSQPKTTNNDASAPAGKPKYMNSLLAAAQVRKRDQLRAKEKLLAREREAEGDAFADKESFVTGAYKRQQEEMRRQEEEEARKEKDDEERRKKEGAGMKILYRSMLDKGEERHKEMLKAVEENKNKKDDEKGDTSRTPEQDKGKSEVDLAKEKGAIVNEDGEVVDKRQLLNAGLNAAAAPKPRPRPRPSSNSGPGSKRAPNNSREDETRALEERLLGKHAFSSDEEEEDRTHARASKSRRMEDELMAAAGFDSD